MVAPLGDVRLGLAFTENSLIIFSGGKLAKATSTCLCLNKRTERAVKFTGDEGNFSLDFLVSVSPKRAGIYEVCSLIIDSSRLDTDSTQGCASLSVRSKLDGGLR